MTQEQALDVQREIERICNKLGLFLTVEHQKRPDLKMIIIKEISIKVTDTERNMPMRR